MNNGNSKLKTLGLNLGLARTGAQKMSLRQIAKELGISPAYLSYMLNGKRPWRKDLYQRYLGVVNTFVNSEEEGANTPPADNGGGNGGTDWVRTSDLALMKRPL